MAAALETAAAVVAQFSVPAPTATWWLTAPRTIRPEDILGFLCLRNEAARLPYYLAHMRRLGVRHILAVDNASTDDSCRDPDGDQPDVSLWRTEASYKASPLRRGLADLASNGAMGTATGA